MESRGADSLDWRRPSPTLLRPVGSLLSRPQIWLVALLLLVQVVLPGLHRAQHHAHGHAHGAVLATAPTDGCGCEGPGDHATPGAPAIAADDDHDHHCWLCAFLAQTRDGLPGGRATTGVPPPPCVGRVSVPPAQTGVEPTWTTPPGRGPPAA